jgi:hypothetical protein
MLHQSRVLKIIPKDLQPPEDIKCLDCIHGNLIYTRDRASLDGMDSKKVEIYCKNYFYTKYSSTGEETTREVLDCDGYDNEIKEDDD